MGRWTDDPNKKLWISPIGFVGGKDDIICRRFMYTIERLNDTSSEREVWVPEIQYKTEFKAFVSARTKCMATGKTYRVFNTHSKNVQCVITLRDCKKMFNA